MTSDPLFESGTVKKDLEGDPQLSALEDNQNKWMLCACAGSGFSHRACVKLRSPKWHVPFLLFFCPKFDRGMCCLR